MRHVSIIGSLLVFVVGVLPLDALTIYRIGGTSLPAPDLAATEGVEFVQIEWSDIQEDLW